VDPDKEIEIIFKNLSLTALDILYGEPEALLRHFVIMKIRTKENCHEDLAWMARN
jgi:hypothetical protein